jgi:tripartite-type tricarboxylate transporter receptor subunit TctC
VKKICISHPSLLASFILMAWLIAPYAIAAEQAPTAYPNKAIHLVVPFPAGGSADLVARIMAKPLADKLGQPVVIDNKPGADGAIAAEAVASAAPDGYTLFMATYGAMSAVPSLHKVVHYDPLKDFTPISAAGKFSMFLFAHPSVPAQTLNEFIAYEHTHAGQVNYGTGNVASIVMAAEMTSQAKLHMTQVPYKGEVPAMTDFVAGRIQLMFATPANALPFVKEGKLKAWATLSDKRSTLLPETPTWHEAGMHDLPIVPWAGVFGPAQMPKDITHRLSNAIIDVLQRDDVESEFAKLGFEPFGSTPEKLEAYVKKQRLAWQRAIQSAGILPE